MSIGERLKKARQSLGLSQIEIAEVLGFQSNFLSNIERGAKKPPKKLIELFSSRYKINANWILTGEGGMAIENAVTTKAIPLVKEMENLINGITSQKFSEIEARLSALEAQLKQEKPALQTSTGKEGPLYTAETAPGYGEEGEEYEEIPYVWDIAAGPPIDIDEDRGEAAAVLKRLLRKGERYYAASVRGGSMTEAGIRDGDLVLIRCADVPKDGAIQVVRYKNKSTLKLLREVEGKGWELHYRDGSGKVITCDSNEYEVQGEFEAVLPVTANLRDR
jgi:SOS-response transcriptional repressor LexA